MLVILASSVSCYCFQRKKCFKFFSRIVTSPSSLPFQCTVRSFFANVLRRCPAILKLGANLPATNNGYYSSLNCKWSCSRQPLLSSADARTPSLQIRREIFPFSRGSSRRAMFLQYRHICRIVSAINVRSNELVVCLFLVFTTRNPTHCICGPTFIVRCVLSNYGKQNIVNTSRPRQTCFTHDPINYAFFLRH